MSVVPPYAVILTSFIDLIKYKAIQNVNTGDHTLNSLLITLSVSLIGLMTYFLQFNLIEMIKFRYLKLNVNNLTFYQKYYHAHNSEFQELVLYHNSTTNANKSSFVLKLSSLLYKLYGNKCFAQTITAGKGVNDEFQVLIVSPFYHVDNNIMFPVFLNEGNIVYVVYETLKLKIYYPDSTILDKFIKFVNDSHIPPPPPIDLGGKFRIFNAGDDNPIGYVYPDRNINRFVSKYKNSIIELCDHFLFVNNEQNNYQGFGSYNIGIMLQGMPGTGKTLIMKLLSNYLKRDIQIVDMKKIKTASDFKAIFKDYTKFIYVLDEFDCVQNVVKSRDDDTLVIESNKRQELTDHYIKLLSVMASRTVQPTGGAGGEDLIAKELDSIKNQIHNIDNSLSLDSILTVLDGIDEMRGRVIIGATNYIERIDSALLREGRFDLKIKLEQFDETELKDFIRMTFSLTENEEKKLRKAKLQKKFTPAQLTSMISGKNFEEFLQSVY